MNHFGRKLAWSGAGLVGLLATAIVVYSQTTGDSSQKSPSTARKTSSNATERDTSAARNRPDAQAKSNSKPTAAADTKDQLGGYGDRDHGQQGQLTDLLSGYYGGYSDGYVDGLEDAVYYIIDLHHQGQDLQAQNGEMQNEHIQQYRGDLRKRMRDRRNGGHDSWVQSAGTRKLNGVVVDQWVTRHKGDKHQFVELETSPGVRFDVDLGSNQAFASAPIRTNDRIAVRGSFHDPSAEHPTFVAQRVWIGDRPSIAVNGGVKSEQQAPAPLADHNVQRTVAAKPAAMRPPESTLPALGADSTNSAAESGERVVTVQLTPGPRGRAFLGIQIDRRMENEVRISHVYENSPAAKAGLRPGDILTALNGQELNSPADLTDDLSELQANQTIQLSVERGQDSLPARHTDSPTNGPERTKSAAVRSIDDSESR